MRIRQAVIHAGGEGTRLRPVTYEMPKPLVPVQGRPILSWLVEWLARYGVERVTVTIPPRWAQAFTTWREEQPVRPRLDLWSEPEPMGTMGALVHELQDRFMSEPVFVTNGDELKGFDLGVLARSHRRQREEYPEHAVTLALIQVSNPSDYGVPEFEGSRIIRYHEKPTKPPCSLAHAGLYVLETTVLADWVKAPHFLMFEKDLFPLLAEQGRLGGCELEGAWFDCGTLERWERAIREWPASTSFS